MKKILIILVIAVIAGVVWFVGKREKVAPPVTDNVTETVEEAEIEDGPKIFGGVEFTLTSAPNPPKAGEETILTYNLKVDSRPATDMETLSAGVYGKGVAINKSTQETMPVEIIRSVTPHGTLKFRTVFPESGVYTISTQFKRAGEIITANFELSVI